MPTNVVLNLTPNERGRLYRIAYQIKNRPANRDAVLTRRCTSICGGLSRALARDPESENLKLPLTPPVARAALILNTFAADDAALAHSGHQLALLCGGVKAPDAVFDLIISVSTFARCHDLANELCLSGTDPALTDVVETALDVLGKYQYQTGPARKLTLNQDDAGLVTALAGLRTDGPVVIRDSRHVLLALTGGQKARRS